MTLEADGPVSYSEEYRVPFGDTDSAGVVFYPNYYRWFDRMTHELFRHIDQPLAGYGPDRAAPVLVETHCNFISSLKYDDLVTLRATVATVGGKSFRIDHAVLKDGALTATGYEVRVWVEIRDKTAEAVALPDQVRKSLLG